VRVSQDDLRLFYNTAQLVKQLPVRVRVEDDRMRAERDRIEVQLAIRRDHHLRNITVFQSQLDGLKNFTNLFFSKDANECINYSIISKVIDQLLTK
jgi:hypothetical protein